MPRPKTLSDDAVLDAALRLLRRHGPEALTFAHLASVCGLASATLVQRFSSKAELIQRTLLHAWDALDARTARAIAEAPRTPEGAVRILVELSAQHAQVEAFAQGLLLLREDLRDPLLRARGAAWHAALAAGLEACFEAAPTAPSGIGDLLAAQWQGQLVWWSFEPHTPLPDFIETRLRQFLAALGFD